MDPVQEIKHRLSIEEVVSQYVQLKKAGRNLKGLCPFHDEKTPSFIVSPEKGLAYCFGCQKGGDMFRFIMEVERLEFRGALELLADKAQVDLPDQKPEARQEKTMVLDLQKKAQEFFVRTLKSAEGAKAKEVLAERGLDEKTIERFGIGAAPAAWDGLIKELQKHGASEKDLVTAGLAIRRDEKRDGAYDRFRNRIMFPLRDPAGKILAFTGRTLDGSEPKYLNSPESASFSKGTLLYGLDLARENIKKEGRALIVEGQMDVIACHQFDLGSAIATSGTALTDYHVNYLAKITKDILFLYDRDNAGIEATMRGMQLALNNRLNAKVVEVPGGKDPDEALRHDKAAVMEAVDNPLPVDKFIISVLKSRYDLNSSEEKRKAIDEFFEFMHGITDPLIVEPLIGSTAGVFNVRPEYFREGYEKSRRRGVSYVSSKPVEKVQKAQFRPEDLMLGLIIGKPELFDKVAASAHGGEIFTAEARRFYDVLVATHEENENPELEATIAAFPDELKMRAEMMVMAADEHWSNDKTDILEEEVKVLLTRLNKDYVRRRNREISAVLRDAEPDQQKYLTEELNQLLQSIK